LIFNLLAIRASFVEASDQAQQTASACDDDHKSIRPLQSVTRVTGGVISTTTYALRGDPLDGEPVRAAGIIVAVRHTPRADLRCPAGTR
jgi:hypothetical protein